MYRLFLCIRKWSLFAVDMAISGRLHKDGRNFAYCFPEIIPSDGIVGEITREASEATGLPVGVKVVCGGVDNSCMALGAKGTAEGRMYTSLGSSAWIALVSAHPVLDFTYKPYVFAHVIKGMYASATCIFLPV